MTNQIDTPLKGGFRYLVETIRDGVVIDTEEVHNLMPNEGVTYVLGSSLKGVLASSAWYAGVFEGNYTPLATDTAAAFPAAATETTAYTPALRQAVTLGAIAGGACDNTAAPAFFTMSAAKTIQGAFISSASGQGATTGVLISAVKFAAAKVLGIGDQLKVTAGFSLVSA